MNASAMLSRLSAMPPRLRWLAGAATGALILATIVAALLAHPSRTALFSSPLHPEQLSEVEERLASWNTPFTPTADNVLIDARRRNAVLLRLSLAGVPHEHVDASGDVLSKLGALTPQSVVDAQTREGLAGDIELALRGIDGVQDARVIVAPAKAADFADDSSRAASASVRLRLTPGTQLSSDAISGIRAFVAAAVPGLDARSVTIVDDRGVALTDTPAGSEAGNLQSALQSALDQSVGAGSTIVRVHVEYDRRALESRDVRRGPVSASPIANSVQSERYADSSKRYERSNSQLDRGSETHEVSASAPPGRIARISAAVFVDESRITDLTQIRSLAAATLGIDPHRGDALAVGAMPFARDVPAKKDGWWLAYGAVVPLLPTLIMALVVLSILRWAGAPLSSLAAAFGRRALVAKTAEAVKGRPPANVRTALASEPPHTAAAIISALPAATAAAVLDMYPEHERSAIVARMQRPASPLLAGVDQFLADA